ncbi:receptor activity-modifying protein 1 isoform X1 [Tachyglossus aculeatus]|uniref:receptor activity-modifying protein 1 isoform X1 n=1 Tax=Tachyglossus aculeatus TaxID=9261 RepID=UPI0018F763B3|nr:receptor activity-modifying protein 1 isoform X1 [Tachyglossus aculeatus]
MGTERAAGHRTIFWLLIAHHFFVASACHEPHYGQLIDDLCLTKFKLDMDAIGPALWCDWGKTLGSYGELTNCTALIAQKLDCYWPSQLVDTFFIAIHRAYFKHCALTGRKIQDPPYHILCPFIAVPILVTLLMTALVAWRSKRNEGIV